MPDDPGVDHPGHPWLLEITAATWQVLYSQDDYVTDPILAAVGQLQFEVVQFRRVLPAQIAESTLL